MHFVSVEDPVGGAGRNDRTHQRWPIVAAALACWLSSEGTRFVFTDGPGDRWVGLLSLVGIGVGVLATVVFRTLGSSSRAMPSLAVLLVWSVLSVFWSSEPDVTLRWQQRSLVWIFVLVALTPPLRLEQRIVAAASGLFLGILVSVRSVLRHETLAHADPDLFRLWNGAWLTNNLLAHASVLFLVLLACMVALNRQLWIYSLVPAGLTVWMLLISRSKTPLVGVPAAFIVGIAFFPYVIARKRSRNPGRAPKVIGVGAGLAALLGLTLALQSTPFLRKQVWENRTFSQRSDFWHAAWPSIRQQWLTGYGFGNTMIESAQGRVIEARAGFALAHMHNGFLDAFAAGGVVSLGALLFLIGQAIVRSWRRLRSDDPMRGLVGFVLVVTVIVLNFTEPDFFFSMVPSFFVLVSIAAPSSARRAFTGVFHATGSSRGRFLDGVFSKEPLVLPIGKRKAIFFLFTTLSLLVVFRGYSSYKRQSFPFAKQCGKPSHTTKSIFSDISASGNSPSILTRIDPREKSGKSPNLLASLSIRSGPPPYDLFTAREARLQCGLLHSTSEVTESLALGLQSRGVSYSAFTLEFTTLQTVLRQRPDLVDKFSSSGSFSVEAVARWAIDVPVDDPSYGSLWQLASRFRIMTNPILHPIPWWVQILP
jgi:O-antigen ligase